MLRFTVATTLTSLLLLHTPLNGTAGDTIIPLASFDTSPDSQPWRTVNDPVMGGGSDSTITITPGLGVWEGEVKIVKSLNAPGFCTLRTGNADEGYNDDSTLLPDATGTKYLVVSLAETSGDLAETSGDLPKESFSVDISLKGKRLREGGYRATFSDAHCCGKKCRVVYVPWDAFKMSWRGKKMREGKKVSDNLDKITRIGLSTSGTAGKFSLSIKSFSATDSATPCNEGQLEWS